MGFLLHLLWKAPNGASLPGGQFELVDDDGDHELVDDDGDKALVND